MERSVPKDLDDGLADSDIDGFAVSGIPSQTMPEEAGPSKSFLPRPFHELFANRRAWLLMLVSGHLVTIASSMVPAFAIGILIDTALSARSDAALWGVVAALAVAQLLQTVVSRACARATTALSRARSRELASQVVDRMERAPLMALEAHTSAFVLGRLRSIPKIVGFFVHWYIVVLSRPVFFGCAVLWLTLHSVLLGSVILLMTLVYVRLYWAASRKARAQFAQESERAQARSQALHEFVQALPTLRMAGSVGRFYRAMQARRGASEPAIEPWIVRFTRSYSGIGFIVVLFLSGWLVIHGELSIGTLIIINVVFRRILSETRYVISRVRRFYRNRTAAETMGRFLDSLGQVSQLAETGPIDHTASVPDFERIVLRDVGLTRPGSDVPALQKVDLVIEKGEFVALVGASGSGKTTLLKTIAGLYNPTRGSVSYEGGDGSRQSIGYVSAGDMNFNRSVHRNISLLSEASREAVVAAARRAGAHEFIMQLDSAYDTRLTNAGAGLSHGQKARIAIARCLAMEAPLMLMDEPTSALDPVTERRLMDHLRLSKGAQTIVVATHRLASALAADRVVVVHQGRVVEEGVPVQLQARADSAFALWCRASAHPGAARSGRGVAATRARPAAPAAALRPHAPTHEA